MKRRQFIYKMAAASVTLGVAPLVKLNASASLAALPYDLVAVKGGSPVDMFEKGIMSLGGMKTFIKPNQTVVIKPNIGWNKPPEMAANTNPELVGRVIKHCLDAGAKSVYVFDNTCNEWNLCYKNSGIEKAVKDAGGKMVPGNAESYYHPVTVPKGKNLKSAKVHELILESDVFINVPILKSHGGASITASMKNLMGVVWDRGTWHKNDLHQCIADFATYCKPHLNIVDAYRVMKKNGPQGVSINDVTDTGMLVISTDMVTADASAAKIFGIEPDNVGHIKIAHEMGVGNKNIDSLKVNRIKL